MGTLEGKVAVITGGGTGIGLAIAERFADEGAQVVIVGRRRKVLDDALTLIGPGALAVGTDVSDPAQVQRLFDGLDRVDLLVTCAGGAVFGPIDKLAPQRWKDLFDGRFFGQINCCHYAVPKMPPGSAIMLCSGIAGNAAIANYAGGAALCGGVNAMGRALALELAPRGIRVNVLSPGLITGTDIKSNLPDEDRQHFFVQAVDRIPLKRPGKPEDIADAARFLAVCDYATGMVLDVDGGWTVI